jgi:4-hydroxybenzoate polyprenyltransferase
VSSFTNHPFVKVLVYANVFISICAFAQVLLTYVLFQVPYNFDTISYLVFVLTGTYVQYNVQRGYMITHYNLHTERSQWLHKHKRTMLYSNIVGLVILLCLCNSLSWTSIIIMVVAEIVSSLYYLPPFNLRKQGYIKPFLISAVWVVSCVAVPLVEAHKLSSESYYFMAAQFLFVAELCLVFDIKDASADLAGGVRTYANVLGERFTRFFCALLLVGSFVCRWFYDPHLALVSIIVLVPCFIVTLLSSDKKHAFWFYLAVDGMLILQLVVVSLSRMLR